MQSRKKSHAAKSAVPALGNKPKQSPGLETHHQASCPFVGAQNSSQPESPARLLATFLAGADAGAAALAGAGRGAAVRAGARAKAVSASWRRRAGSVEDDIVPWPADAPSGPVLKAATRSLS